MASSNELRAAQNAIASAIAQHTHYQHRASSAVVNEINQLFQKAGNASSRKINNLLEELTSKEKSDFMSGRFTTDRLRELRDEIQGLGASLSAAMVQKWDESGPSLAGYEAGYMVSLLDNTFEGLPALNLGTGTIYRRSMNIPLSGGRPYGGRLIGDLFKDFGPEQAAAIMATVRVGVASGQTNDEIVKQIRGTSAMNFQDGIIQQARNSAEMLVRTARNHISNQSYSQVYDNFGVDEVVDFATLDGRTSKYCASIDGRRHKVGSRHPMPPYHPHCRTVQIPAFDDDAIGTRPFVRALKVKGRDGERSFRSIGNMTENQRDKAGLEIGRVNAKTDYGKWFANQDAEFKREWLGPTRYKLYTQGKYQLERFVDPNTGRQYSIDELRMRDAQTFRKIFGE